MHRENVTRIGLTFLLSLALSTLPVPVFAQAKQWNDIVINGKEITCLAGPDKDVATIQCLVPLFSNVVMAVVELAGVALFIMFIVGGFSFITSGGNPKQLEQARNTLTYAIIGLVVVVVAFLIIQLISTITGVEGLHTFTIPGATQ